MEYQLAWYINKALGITMTKQKDIEIKFLNGNILCISNYLFETENCCCKLIRNKSVYQEADRVDFLLPELNKFDFLMQLRGFEDTFDDDTVRRLLVACKPVQFLQKFDPLTIKSRENLIFHFLSPP